MVYKPIGKDLKEHALWLLENDYIPADISDIFGVSERSLQQWKKTRLIMGVSYLLPSLFADGLTFSMPI